MPFCSRLERNEMQLGDAVVSGWPTARQRQHSRGPLLQDEGCGGAGQAAVGNALLGGRSGRGLAGVGLPGEQALGEKGGQAAAMLLLPGAVVGGRQVGADGGAAREGQGVGRPVGRGRTPQQPRRGLVHQGQAVEGPVKAGQAAAGRLPARGQAATTQGPAQHSGPSKIKGNRRKMDDHYLQKSLQMQGTWRYCLCGL